MANTFRGAEVYCTTGTIVGVPVTKPSLIGAGANGAACG